MPAQDHHKIFHNICRIWNLVLDDDKPKFGKRHRHVADVGKEVGETPGEVTPFNIWAIFQLFSLQ